MLFNGNLTWILFPLLALPEMAQAGVASGDGVLTITLAAQPGAPLYTVYQNLESSFGPADRPDILVIEGGVNDVFMWGQNLATLETKFSEGLIYCVNYARSCGVPFIYVLELTPVIPEIVDHYSDYTARVAPVESRIEFLNTALPALASRMGFTIIPVYARFRPHWVAAPVSWCLWQGSDSVHPNAAGNREIGRAIADAIRPRAPRGLPVRITLAGDSILAAVNWPDNQKPAAYVREYLWQTSKVTPAWRLYD